MSIECNFSFDDLYNAAYGKNLSKKEKEKFTVLSQDTINELVLKWTKKANWKTKIKKGIDGKNYLSFHP